MSADIQSNAALPDQPTPTTENPANLPAAEQAKEFDWANRVPMSVPVRKLEMPEIEGYHCHWFLRRDVPDALRAGYVMVTPDEVKTSRFGSVANPVGSSASMSLGNQITILGNKSDEQGNPEMLYFMKLPLKYYNEDMKRLDDRNRGIMSAIFGQQKVMGSEQYKGNDLSRTYVKEAQLTQKPILNRAHKAPRDRGGPTNG